MPTILTDSTSTGTYAHRFASLIASGEQIPDPLADCIIGAEDSPPFLLIYFIDFSFASFKSDTISVGTTDEPGIFPSILN